MRVDAGVGGLARDCVVNVSQVVTLDKRALGERLGRLPLGVVTDIDAGLRLALDLDPPRERPAGRYPAAP